MRLAYVDSATSFYVAYVGIAPVSVLMDWQLMDSIAGSIVVTFGGRDQADGPYARHNARYHS